MIMHMFSVYDEKASTFCAPFFSVNADVAIRDFAYAANDLSTDIGRYPIDYTIYHIGTFDTETAVVLSTQPKNLGMASNFTKGLESNV